MKITPAVVSLCLLCVMQAVPVAANAATPVLLAQAETPGSLAPPQQTTQQPYTLQPKDPYPMRIAGHQAIYPQAAKAQHLGGVVKLQVVIDTDGNVTKVTVVSATNRVFVDASLAAVKQWKFRPYLLNGVPTAVQSTITVNFTFGQ
jgi:TonB family protein